MPKPQNPEKNNPMVQEAANATEAPMEASPNRPDEESLTKIREILIGPTKRHIDQRMTGIQQRIDQSIRTSEEMMMGRFETMQKQFRDELEGLISQMANQRDEQAKETADTKREVESQFKRMREKAVSMSDKMTSMQQQIRSDLDRELESMKRNVEQSSESSLNAIVEETSRLRAELADRETLSSLFSELALRISGPIGSAAPDPNKPDMDLDALIDQRTGGK